MPQVHSTYSTNSGTSLVLGMTISSVFVPSVVDGILLFLWAQNGADAPVFGTGGSQSFTLVNLNGTNLYTYFLPRPEVGTFDMIVGGMGSSRGAMFAILLTGTKTTGYSNAVDEAIGTSTTIITNPVASGNMVKFDSIIYSNRDAVGAPAATGAFQGVIHNTIVNSGGGANSYGFCVSYQTISLDQNMLWLLNSSAAFTAGSIALLNSNFNAPGALTIRHAP